MHTNPIRSLHGAAKLRRFAIKQTAEGNGFLHLDQRSSYDVTRTLMNRTRIKTYARKWAQNHPLRRDTLIESAESENVDWASLSVTTF